MLKTMMENESASFANISIPFPEIMFTTYVQCCENDLWKEIEILAKLVIVFIFYLMYFMNDMRFV